jgi:aerobic-type carbon monoxide dehydrogenase small subunit (CoxS/CutS family)
MAIEFELNGENVSLDVDPAMPLLWAIRDLRNLHCPYRRATDAVLCASVIGS